MKPILLKNIILNGSLSDIFVCDGLISKISKAGQEVPAIDSGVEVMDCSGKTAFPGFINMHTHSAMAMMRGVQEDTALHDWLAKIWGMEAKITPDYIYWASKVAALEMIKTGTTTFYDQYWFSPTTRKAAMELGINPCVTYVVLDRHDKEAAAFQKDECEQYYEMSKSWKEDSAFGISIHAIYSVSEPMILWATEYARKRNLLIHIHVSETLKEVEDCKAAHGGLTPVEYLDRLGVLGPDVIAAHSLWLSDSDIQLLGERKVNCVHNVNSNLKLASGYMFKYQELSDAGVNICLGTDGSASSNNLDMLEAMKTSALLQKVWRNNPEAWPLEELAASATSNGAKALRLNTGVLEVGKRADILIVDTDNTFFLSPAPFLANFVYSAHSDCIDSVICGGRIVMKNRVVHGEKEILENARKIMNDLN
ncbi:MAG: amidohydrolase [Bacteroidales bacterium]|nr:amidohydrolase [Bacteroidales bacterium]